MNDDKKSRVLAAILVGLGIGIAIYVVGSLFWYLYYISGNSGEGIELLGWISICGPIAGISAGLAGGIWYAQKSRTHKALDRSATVPGAEIRGMDDDQKRQIREDLKAVPVVLVIAMLLFLAYFIFVMLPGMG